MDDIIAMAREAGAEFAELPMGDAWVFPEEWQLQRLVALAQAAERNKLAAWMIAQGYATGHGDTTEDLLKELEWQVRESEREACLSCYSPDDTAQDWADKIRARG
jgi:hypothetical protein